MYLPDMLGHYLYCDDPSRCRCQLNHDSSCSAQLHTLLVDNGWYRFWRASPSENSFSSVNTLHSIISLADYSGTTNGDDSLLWNVWETQSLYRNQYGRTIATCFDIFLMFARFSGKILPYSTQINDYPVTAFEENGGLTSEDFGGPSCLLRCRFGVSHLL